MGNALTALMLAAGAAGLAYAKLGKRVGYGNAANVWTLVGITFAATFVVFMIILSLFVDLGN